MGTYTIKDLERISNTKAHTIRMWEQRYGLLTPRRTDTNIRHYDDAELTKLLSVCALLRSGMKISNLAQLSKGELSALLAQQVINPADTNARTEAYLNQLLQAVVQFNTQGFLNTLDDAVENLGWTDTYQKIIYPLLVRTGILWLKDDIIPAHEHFQSNLIRQKLFSAIDRLPQAVTTQKWLLFLNEYEDHEIGLIFSHLIISQHGHQVVNLGSRVPYKNFADVVAACQPTHLYTFFVGNTPDGYPTALLEKLSVNFPDKKIYFSAPPGVVQLSDDQMVVRQIANIEELTNIVGQHKDSHHA